MAKAGTFTSARNPRGKAVSETYRQYTTLSGARKALEAASAKDAERLFYNLRKTAMRRAAALERGGYLSGSKGAGIASAIPDLTRTYKNTSGADRVRAVAEMSKFVVSGPSVTKFRENKKRAIEHSMEVFGLTRKQAIEWREFVHDYYENAVAGRYLQYEALADFYDDMNKANVNMGIQGIDVDYDMVREAAMLWEADRKYAEQRAKELSQIPGKHTYEEFWEALNG